MVDLKVTANVTKCSKTLDMLWTMNNVLRLDELKVGDTFTLEGEEK